MSLLFGIAEVSLGANGWFVRRRRADGFYWNVSGTPAFEAWNAAHIANYGIAATETDSGVTGQYTAADPASTTDGDYLLVKSAGASLAAGDLQTGVRWQDNVGGNSIAASVWSDSATYSAGSKGAELAAAGSGSGADPLLNDVPGSYPPGSAGFILGNFGPTVWSYGTRTLTSFGPIPPSEPSDIPFANPHVGDVGTALVVVIVDQNFTVVDVSAATAMNIYLQKPNGVVLTKTAVLDTTGADGAIRYNTVAGDFDQAGLYKMFGRVTTPAGGPWSSIDTEFLVQGNFA